MQTSNGFDNSRFFFDLEQRQAINYFNNHKHDYFCSGLDDMLEKKGFIPAFNKQELKPSLATASVANRISKEEASNCSLAIDLYQLGVSFNHPQLLYKPDEALLIYKAFLLGSTPLPFEGFKSPEITESNVNSIRYCLETYESFPKLEYNSYDGIRNYFFEKMSDDKIKIIEDECPYDDLKDCLQWIKDFPAMASLNSDEAEALEHAEPEIIHDSEDKPIFNLMVAYPAGTIGYGGHDGNTNLRWEMMNFPEGVSKEHAIRLIMSMGLICPALFDDVVEEDEETCAGGLFSEDADEDY
jgi:hypothetical protein